MKKRRKQYSAGAIIWIIFKYVSLVFFSFVAVIPIISCVITAFKTEEEYKTTNVMTLPQNWFNFDNFVEAFQRANMGRAFVNSVIVMVCVLIGAIIIGTQLAYVLNRFQFPGNGLIRNLFLFAALLPGVAMQVTVYQIMLDLGFINHLYGYIIMMMERMSSPSTSLSSTWKIFRCLLDGVGNHRRSYPTGRSTGRSSFRC